MNLHKEFCRLAGERRKLTNELLALIPEIDRERVWEREGFQSVFHYAQVIAGLSAGVVEKRLRLEKRLENKPVLKEAIKTAGVHKVALVSRVATVENQEKLAGFVTVASKRAVEEFVREKPKEKMEIELDEEMMVMFLKIKQKYGEKLSNKEVLRRLLKDLEEEFIPGDETLDSETRHIPAARKRAAIHSTGGKCRVEGCSKPFSVIHHPERWSEVRSHRRLAPLCDEHHQLAHNGYLDEEKWKVRRTQILKRADVQYREVRVGSLLK